jgi:hypothetical protein
MASAVEVTMYLQLLRCCVVLNIANSLLQLTWASERALIRILRTRLVHRTIVRAISVRTFTVERIPCPTGASFHDLSRPQPRHPRTYISVPDKTQLSNQTWYLADTKSSTVMTGMNTGARSVWTVWI